VAFEAPGLSATVDIPTRGFGGLAALARAGHAGGEEVVCCPLRTELVKKDDAEVVDGILLRLPRPTLIMCTYVCVCGGYLSFADWVRGVGVF
jgi:hypothetical protein